MTDVDRRDPELAAELLRRAEVDQRARAALLQGRAARDTVARGLEVDAENSAWLRTVLDRFGWPGSDRVGEQAAHAAWLLAQHADRQPELQERCLEAMEQAVAAGQAAAEDLAYLTDRVRVNRGLPQRYGTQLRGGAGGWVPQRLEDPAAVDTLRAEVGLEPLAAYLSRVSARHGDPAPMGLACPGCGTELSCWPPDAGQAVELRCERCQRVSTVRVQITAS